MGVVLLTCADIFAVETHYKANAFANVFNGKGGFSYALSGNTFFNPCFFNCLANGSKIYSIVVFSK